MIVFHLPTLHEGKKENTHREELLSAPTCCADLRSALYLEREIEREREREREI